MHAPRVTAARGAQEGAGTEQLQPLPIAGAPL